MLVINKRWGRIHRFTVMFKPGEFAPISVHQDRARLFADFDKWGVSLTSLAGALGVHPDRVRGWRTRTQYRIPELFWLQLVHAHKSIFQHLLENEYIDTNGDVLPRWLVKRKPNKKKGDTE